MKAGIIIGVFISLAAYLCVLGWWWFITLFGLVLLTLIIVGAVSSAGKGQSGGGHSFFGIFYF